MVKCKDEALFKFIYNYNYYKSIGFEYYAIEYVKVLNNGHL